MATVDELPEPLRSIVHRIGANHPDSGGLHYQARAELDARLAIAQTEAAAQQAQVAKRLVWATWALVLATIGLIVVALTV
jgi:hypothetical protein